MNKATQTFRYRPSAVWPDIARSGGGLLVTALPLPWLLDSPIAFTVFACLAIAFAAFTISTAARLRTTVRVDEAGISTSGIRGATVAWNQMRAVDLSYFSTRRDRERGWMQLRVRGGASTIRIDSALEEFQTVADRTIAAARERDIELSEVTLANSAALASGALYRPPPEPATRSGWR